MHKYKLSNMDVMWSCFLEVFSLFWNLSSYT